MSAYNMVLATVTCPSCSGTIRSEIQARFGYGNFDRYSIGDKVEWRSRKQPQNGGRPDGGNIDAEGYVECEHCDLDHFLIVKIREDRLVSVELNTARPGYKPR